MKRLLAAAALVAGSTVLPGVAGRAQSTVAATAATPTRGADIVLDRARIDTAVGSRFTIRSTFVNRTAAATEVSVAHLNVVSLTGEAYVDPEDWSTSRSAMVSAVEPGRAASTTWNLQAVSTGSFDVYVVLLPAGVNSAGVGPLTVSSAPVHVTVVGRSTADAGGSLPIVVAVPALLGAALGVVRYRLRRSG